MSNSLCDDYLRFFINKISDVRLGIFLQSVPSSSASLNLFLLYIFKK